VGCQHRSPAGGCTASITERVGRPGVNGWRSDGGCADRFDPRRPRPTVCRGGTGADVSGTAPSASFHCRPTTSVRRGNFIG